MSETVQLPLRIQEAIIAHAREGKPEEICGVIRGRRLVAGEVYRGRNIAEERIENYTLDPETLLLQFRFEAQGDEMMGVYHSHPVSVAYPSATDAWWSAAYPDSIYFICSLEFDNAPVIRAFRLGQHAPDLPILRLREALAFYETRPHLFAYYQESSPLPAPLADLADQLTPPFYIVFYEEDDGSIESRVVSIEELTIA
jgi:proteasome lid subunit RPN8/RPN11